MKKTLIRGLAPAAILALTMSQAYAAGEHIAPMQEVAKTKVAAWLNNSTVIEAVKAQNSKNASLSQSQIDKLDKTWRAE